MSKNKSPLTLGYLPTRRNNFSHKDADKFNKLILGQLKRDYPNIKIVGLEFLNKEAMLYDTADSERVIEHFQSHGVDALFIPHCSFGTEDAVARVARGIGKPVLLWGPRDARPDTEGLRLRDSQCGLFATSKVMQRFGVQYTYILNSHLDDPVYKRGIDSFLRAANVIRLVKNAHIGQVSTRPGAFYSVITNEGLLLEKFGIEIIPVTLSEITQRVKKIVKEGGDELKAAIESFRKRYNVIKYTDDILANIAGLKLALKEFSEKNQLNALAVQCWTAIQAELGISTCLAHAELTEEDLPVACETDLVGAIGSLMMQAALFFEEPTFFSDLTNRHPDNENAELLWHCGVFPASLAKEGVSCSIENHPLLPDNPPGICNWQLKEGPLTVIRLDESNGKFSLFCGEGESIDGPYNIGTFTYLEVEDWPLWEEKIIYGPYIHHVICAYGNYAHVFHDVCRYLDITFDPATPTAEELRKRRLNNTE